MSARVPRLSADLPMGTLAVMLAALLATASVTASGWTMGERELLGQGQLWRLWTANLAHFSLSHLFWSGLLWCVAGGLMERECPAAWRRLVLVVAPAVTLLALLGDLRMERYGGLSGLATAPLVWFGLTRIRDGAGLRRLAGATVLVLVAGKILHDLLSGDVLLARFDPHAAEVRVAVWAHLAGALGGAWLARRDRGMAGSLDKPDVGA